MPQILFLAPLYLLLRSEFVVTQSKARKSSNSFQAPLFLFCVFGSEHHIYHTLLYDT